LKFFEKQGFGIGTGDDSKYGDFLVCKRGTERKKTLYQSPTKVYSAASHFHAYATACVIEHGQRYTIAMIPVAKGTAMKDMVQVLLKQCQSD
jgi:hypothetical protein